MRRSKTGLYVHFVWATFQRLPLVAPTIEEPLYRCILAEANKLKLELLALGGMPDHVHLVVRKPPMVSESQIMQRIKGVSSTFAQADRVVQYVKNQKTRHADNAVWPDWEEIDEDPPALS